MERSSSQVIATNIAANDFRSAVGARWYNDMFWAGAYLLSLYLLLPAALCDSQVYAMFRTLNETCVWICARLRKFRLLRGRSLWRKWQLYR
jgi:hypothetical protein